MRANRRLDAWSLVRLLVLALALPGVAVGEPPPYRRGQSIEISGTVVDAAGAPVEGLRVVLLAAHQSTRGLRRVEEGFVRVPTTTAADGAFRLEWRWDPYYDSFRIRAEGVSAADAAAGSQQRSVLTEIDLSSRMRAGSPVVVAMAIGDALPPNEDATVLAAGQSADQQRVFDEMGKPDRVDRLELARGVQEVAWWYFERGRSYHFRDGRLEQVMEFELVGSP